MSCLASESASQPPAEFGVRPFGSWWDEFRLCVALQTDQGVPAQEARQACLSLTLQNTVGAAADPQPLGAWWDEFRLCAELQTDQGVPAQEARHACLQE